MARNYFDLFIYSRRRSCDFPLVFFSNIITCYKLQPKLPNDECEFSSISIDYDTGVLSIYDEDDRTVLHSFTLEFSCLN